MHKLIKPLQAAPQLLPATPPTPSTELVTLKVLQVGLCRTDIRVSKGQIPVDRELVLGHECSCSVVHDPSGVLVQGSRVGLNPLLPGDQFMGLHLDGVLQPFIQVERAQLIPAGDFADLRAIAYLEPVAASMAVLKADITRQQRGVIFHDNRISQLTYLILNSLGYNITWVPESPEGTPAESFDYAVETVFEEAAIHQTMLALKRGGLLVVKSRQYSPVAIVPGLLVSKELRLQAVNYYDFTLAMEWLTKHSDLVQPAFGATYPLAEWEHAFAVAEAPDSKKIFISLEA